MKKETVMLLVFIFLAALCIALPFPAKAAPRTIVVPDDYHTIASAVGNATQGDIIFVKQGTYQEQQLIINKTVSLRGENPNSTKIILAPPVGPYGPLGTWGIDYPIKIEANNVPLSGFTITAIGERPVLLGNGGAVLATGSGTRIVGNIFETGVAAIGNQTYIANNTIHDTSRSNFASLSMSGSHQTITNNTVSGIWVENSVDNTITQNTILGTNGPGVPIYGAGIQLRSTTRNQIVANSITSNGPCVLIDCYVGTFGLQTRQSENNTFYHNNFSSNSTHVSQVGYGDGNYSVSNVWHAEGVGNYWSDYNGTDADGDGIGDTPYVIDAKNADQHPLISLFDYQSGESSEKCWATKEPMPVAGAYFKAGVVNDKVYVVDSDFTYEYDLSSWSTRKPMPTRRGDFALATYQHKIYCIGGRTGSGPSAANDVYDPASDSWESKADMPTPRHGLDANVVNGKIYLISGLVPWSDFPNVNIDLYTTYKLTNVTEVYDPATNTWSTKSPIPYAAAYYASAVVDNKIYIISAHLTETQIEPLPLTQIYDPETDSWTTGSSPPYAVEMAGAATVAGLTPRRIYVIGGRQSGMEIAFNQAYDPENNSWSLGAQLPTARYGLAVATAKGKIYAIGGLSGFLYNAVWANVNEEYDPLKDEAVPSTPSTLPPETGQENLPIALSIGAVIAVAAIGLGLLVSLKKHKN